MIFQALRMWLLSLTAMSVAGWVTAVSVFLILYVDKAVSVTMLALLGLWTAAVPIPAMAHLLRWWWRVRVARQVDHVGRRHAEDVRLFEKQLGEIISALR